MAQLRVLFEGTQLFDGTLFGASAGEVPHPASLDRAADRRTARVGDRSDPGRDDPNDHLRGAGHEDSGRGTWAST